MSVKKQGEDAKENRQQVNKDPAAILMPDLLDKVSALEALQAGMNELKEVKQR